MKKYSKSVIASLLTLLIVVTLGLLAGCSSSKPTAAASKTDEKALFTLKIPDIYTPLTVYTPYIAQDAGFFKKYGIEAKFTGVIGPAQHLPSVVSGANDVGGMLLDRTISGIAAGAKVKVVVDSSGPSNKAFPTFEYDVLADSPIKNPSDLLGKKIGVLALGGPHTYTPLLWLKKNGIDGAGKLNFVIIPAGTQEQALRTKQVDVVAFVPHSVDAWSRGGLRKLFSDYDAFGEDGLSAPYYFSTDFISKHPDVVKNFIKAIKETNDYINKNPKEAQAIEAKYAKVDVSKITPASKLNADGLIKESSVNTWISLLKADGTLKKDIKLSDIYTNEFNDSNK